MLRNITLLALHSLLMATHNINVDAIRWIYHHDNYNIYNEKCMCLALLGATSLDIVDSRYAFANTVQGYFSGTGLHCMGITPKGHVQNRVVSEYDKIRKSICIILRMCCISIKIVKGHYFHHSGETKRMVKFLKFRQITPTTPVIASWKLSSHSEKVSVWGRAA